MLARHVSAGRARNNERSPEWDDTSPRDDQHRLLRRKIYAHHMPNSYNANFVHCVFATKQRRDLIPRELRPHLYAYLGGIARKLHCDLLIAGGTGNHAHVLISLAPTLGIAEAMQKLKANSSRWISEQGIAFEWQEG